MVPSIRDTFGQLLTRKAPAERISLAMYVKAVISTKESPDLRPV